MIEEYYKTIVKTADEQFEKFLMNLSTHLRHLHRASEAISVTYAKEYVATDNGTFKAAFLTWRQRSEMMKSMAQTLVQDPRLTDAQLQQLGSHLAPLFSAEAAAATKQYEDERRAKGEIARATSPMAIMEAAKTATAPVATITKPGGIVPGKPEAPHDPIKGD